MGEAVKKPLRIAAQEMEGSAAAGQWLAEPEELAAAAIVAFLENLGPDVLDSMPDVGFMDATACRNAWLKMVQEARDA